MCTSTRAVIAVCVCARERDARVQACHVWSGVGPARESSLHFPAPEQRPWFQVFLIVVQTESFLHRMRYNGADISKGQRRRLQGEKVVERALVLSCGTCRGCQSCEVPVVVARHRVHVGHERTQFWVTALLSRPQHRTRNCTQMYATVLNTQLYATVRNCTQGCTQLYATVRNSVRTTEKEKETRVPTALA